MYKTVQTSSLEDYLAQFETLMNKVTGVTGVTEPQLLSCFVSGLTPILGREVRLAKLENLLEAFDLAKEIEGMREETKNQ